MCFVSRKKLNSLQASVDELKKTIVTQELERLRSESQDYEEMRTDVKNIHLTVKSVRCVSNDIEPPYIEVAYSVPVIKIPLNENGKPVRNEFFRSVNRLNLLSQSDTEKISKVLIEAERKEKL